MDSLSQIALGSAVGVAVMGRRTAVWKAALWGAVAGTLPDLDVFIDHGDPILNMTRHRAESHALFYLSLAAPLLAALVARLHGEGALFRRWWLALWLVLVTHPLLDTMTVYGTQLLQPFSDHPLGVGSVFIIDPLYTLPLIVGVVAALRLKNARGQAWNGVGLVLSTLYLAWGFGAQQHVQALARASLQRQGIEAQALLVTPTPFNSVLWRLVATTSTGYHEGFYSLLDAQPDLRWRGFERGGRLLDQHAAAPAVARIASFSQGFYSLREEQGRLLLTDLRMGQQPHYSFVFDLGNGRPGEPVKQLGMRPDLGQALPWLWRRMGGEVIDPPWHGR